MWLSFALSLGLSASGQALEPSSDALSGAAYCHQREAGSVDPDQTFRIPGIFTSDELHWAFKPNDCPTRGLVVSAGMSADRRAALNAYFDAVRGDQRGGFVDYPVILIGRIRPSGFGGFELVVSDFAVPD
jgi:hypothetical protein